VSVSSSAPKSREGVVLVGFRPGTGASRRSAIEAAAGAKHLRTIGAGTHVLHVARGRVEQRIAQLRRYREVRCAEPDYVVHAAVTPNDTSYNQLWGLPKVKADQAWNVTMGSSNVVVGVVDTGVDYSHTTS